MIRYLNFLGLFLFCLVNGVFAFFIGDFSLNIPYYDDFDSIGTFILTGNDQFGSSIMHVFDQYAEHRIGYTRAVSLLYFTLFGKLNFMHLTWIGIIGLLGIQGLIYSVVHKKAEAFWVLFVVSLMLLNFQYWENMMSAMTALQNNNSPFFSLVALYFLSKGPVKSSRAIAYFFVALTIYTSGNGVLLLPIGFIFIVLSKEDKTQWYLWLAFSILLLIAYFFNYQTPPIVFGGRSNMVDMLLNPMAIYQSFTLFLTSVFQGIGFLHSACFVLGTLLVCYMLWFMYQVVFVHAMKRPLLNWYFLVFAFLLGSAFLVALNRGGNLENMLFSRYKIYSTLVFVFVFLTALELGRPHLVMGVFTVLAVLFSYQSLPYVSTLFNHFNELNYASKTYYLNNRNWKGIYPPFTTNFTNAENASQVCQMLESRGYYAGDHGMKIVDQLPGGPDSTRNKCATFSEKSMTFHSEISMITEPIRLDQFNCIRMQAAKNEILLPLKVNLSPKDLLRKLLGRPIYFQAFTAIIPKSNIDHGQYTLALIQTKNQGTSTCKLMNFQVPYLENAQFHN